MDVALNKSNFAALTLAQLAGYLALLTGLASITSVLANVFVFASWGLDFSSFASASDIIIGGVATLRIALLGMLLVLTAFFLANILKIMGFKRRSWMRWINTALGLIFTSIIFYYFSMLYFSGNQVFISKYGLALTFVVMSGLYFMYFLSDEGHRLALIEMPNLLICSFVTLLFISSYLAQRGQGDLIVVTTTSRCGSEEHVVWISSQSVVTTCSPPPFTHDMKFRMLERSGLVFETHRADHQKSRK